jgi:hypothetical protein
MTTAMFHTRCKAVFQAKDQETHKRTTMYYDNPMQIPKKTAKAPIDSCDH